MKKLLTLLFVLSALLPLHASAKEKTKEKVKDYADHGVNNIIRANMDDKRLILECAQASRQCANVHLKRAESLLDDLKKVKDWRLRDRLKILIGSFISSIPIPEPRVKVLVATLALLADLVTNEGFEKCEITYQIYVEMGYATTALAECQYYNQLSLNSSKGVINNGWDHANHAIDWLTEADMLTVCLEKRTMLGHKGIGDQLSFYILWIRKDLMGDMIQNRRLTHNHSSDLETVIENFPETCAEIHHMNLPLAHKIRERLEIAFKYLRLAEKEWGIQ